MSAHTYPFYIIVNEHTLKFIQVNSFCEHIEILFLAEFSNTVINGLHTKENTANNKFILSMIFIYVNVIFFSIFVWLKYIIIIIDHLMRKKYLTEHKTFLRFIFGIF